MSGYIAKLPEQVERTHVRYNNRYGIALAGDLYWERGMDPTKPHSALIVGAPYGGVKEQGPCVYAGELARRGFVVLTFDPSFNGESGGEPRHVSSPDIFTEDFSAGVDYLGRLDCVDREKIGTIGICGSGGFALSAAQVDTRIKAVVTASLVDISGNYAGLTPEERTALLDRLSRQRWTDAENGEPEYIPSFPEEPTAEIPDGLDPMSAEFYSFYATPRGFHPRARANFTTTSESAFANYSLLGHLDTIAPRPVLILAGENAMTRSLSEGVCERLGENGKLVIVKGANHVDLYDDVTKIPFDQIEEFFQGALQ